MSDLSEDFGQHVRSLREARGLSLRAFASMVGVSSVTIWKWESGDSQPRPRWIGPLAQALEISSDELRIANGGRRPRSRIAVSQGDNAVAAGLDQVAADAARAENDGSAEGLADVIARAKQMIAEASGTGSNNITILIEF